MTFPLDFVFAYRAKHAFRDEELTKSMMWFALVWYSWCCVANLAGQTFILINGSMHGLFEWHQYILYIVMVAGIVLIYIHIHDSPH